MPTALVTGGSQRVGRAIVEDLAAHGWAVAIHFNRSGTDASALAEAIRTGGGRTVAVEADLADLNALEPMLRAAIAALGPIDLLVNNAAIFEADGIGSLDPAAWRRQMTINLEAPVFLAQAFAAALPKNTPGNIVNIIDQRVWKLLPQFLSYQTSKAALWAATQSMAQALAPRIRR